MWDAHLRSTRRVVITGLGVIAPNASGREPFWQACLAGQSGVRRITSFDAHGLSSQIAGEVLDFDPLLYDLSMTDVAQMDRATQFALAAAKLALDDGQLLDQFSVEERERIGVYMGSALACLEAGETNWVQITAAGTREVALQEEIRFPSQLLMSQAPASAIATQHALHGPCMVMATGCSAGADALGESFWAIQEGRADRMLAGGTDASISYGVLDVFCVMGALSTGFNDRPEQASRPYDKQRTGFVMSEGAGVLLLEERELALKRGAHIYAEILDFATNSNAHHMTSLPPSGQPLQDLLNQILSTNQISPEQLGYINSHGSSTPSNEVAETCAYKAVFGAMAAHIPISATKSLIGHTQGAASALETIITALVLDRQWIPPTINQEVPDPQCDLDYVPNLARKHSVQVALTHSSGFGGVNSALLLARPEWKDTYGC